MLRLKIISPQSIVFDGDVERVTVPGTLGEFEILTDHAPIISSLETGSMTYQPQGQAKSELAIQGGFVEVQKNKVSVCVEI